MKKSDSIINIKKEELFDVLVIALKHGFNSYEENESGLKAFNAEVESEWLINKYL